MNLQSLTRAEGVNGNRVIVQASDDGKKDGKRNASQKQIPTGGRSPSHVLIHVIGDAIIFVSAKVGGLGVNKLVARAITANRVVSFESIGDAGSGQESNDDGNNDKQRSEHRNATSSSGTPRVDNLGPKTRKENQGEVDRENARKEKGSNSKGLNKLDDAEDCLIAGISSCNVGLLAVKVCGCSSLLKVPINIGTVVKKNIRGRRCRSTSH